MAKREGYIVRARIIQAITAEHYEPENHAKCYKMVWRRHIFPRFGIGYRSYLNYCKFKPEEELKPTDTGQLTIPFDN